MHECGFMQFLLLNLNLRRRFHMGTSLTPLSAFPGESRPSVPV
jgi:hypothetical protein